MDIQVVMMKQDDPRKCSAAKLVKFGLAKSVKRTTSRTLVLDPFSKKTLLKSDKKLVSSVTGIDCSWNLATAAFKKTFSGIPRKLPPLLAGNPVNYSKINKLTTVEALASAAFILGDEELCSKLLAKFGYKQDLNRSMKGFSSFAISFSLIGATLFPNL